MANRDELGWGWVRVGMQVGEGGGSSRLWAWVGEGRWVEGRDVACGVRMGWGVRGGFQEVGEGKFGLWG